MRRRRFLPSTASEKPGTSCSPRCGGDAGPRASARVMGARERDRASARDGGGGGNVQHRLGSAFNNFSTLSREKGKGGP